MHLLGCNIVYWTNFNVFLFLQDRSDVLELKKEKKESTKPLARSKRSFFPYLEKL